MKGPANFILADHAPEACVPGVPLTCRNYKIWKVAGGGTFNLRKLPSDGFRLISVERGSIIPGPY